VTRVDNWRKHIQTSPYSVERAAKERRAGPCAHTSQAFAVFLPVRSVGVMGDGRRYDHVVALRAAQTIDFMSAVIDPRVHGFA